MKNKLELPKNFVELSVEEMESITSGPVCTASPLSLYDIIRKAFKPIKFPFFNNSK